MLSLFVLFAVLPCASAESKTYTIDALHLTVDAPEGWAAFTRNVDKNDPNS